ncbi:phthiocerol/phthiodiolone dimycocerosyl transferase family protein [Nocardia altamirensis]|uniref:phthiocerol/phthiodiolone dimycocerosyl transferase family protein n=1 Tax=Nocardia altamirensis TaxID=472158 RepID=UPI00083FDDC0|nr:hypothetical protein [Nocardia altamirensis]
MTTSTVVRPLAPSEQMFAMIGVYVGYAVGVSGRLDLGALSAAYEAVLRAYPVLAARLEPSEGGGHAIVSSTGITPDIVVVDGDPDRLVGDQKFDQGTALSAVCVVRDGERTSVTLLTHHSIADGYHSLEVLAELWSFYTDAVHGLSPEREVRPYPFPVEELLAERGIEKIALPVPDAPPPATETAEPVVPASTADEDDWQLAPFSSRCRFSEAETAALVDLGHREGVTINGLVSAAVVLSEAELRGLPLTEIVYTYPVDLRTRVTPQVGNTDGTNLIGFANYLPTGPIELVDLARSICESLRVGLETGTVHQTPLHIPDMMAAGAPAPVPGMVIVTNWGRVPELRSPEELRFTDFRSTLVATPNPDMPQPTPPGGGACILSTFDGRLSIEVHHTKSAAAQQQRRVDAFAAKLRAAIS